MENTRLHDMYNTCQNETFHWNTRDGVKMDVNNMTDSHVFYARRMLLKKFSELTQERQNTYKYFEAIGVRISFKALIFLRSEQAIQEREQRLQMIAIKEANSLFRKAIDYTIDNSYDEDAQYDSLFDDMPMEVFHKSNH